MGLLKPKRRRRRKLRQHATRRCVVGGHLVGWCRGLCTPTDDGYGPCGRLAPHKLQGRTQRAIANYNERTPKDSQSESKTGEHLNDS